MKIRKISALKGLLFVFFGVCLLLPLLLTLLLAFQTDVLAIMASEKFQSSVKNSLATSVAATVLSVCIAMGLAFGLAKSNIRFKGIFAIIFTLPMLIPSISHGMGLVILFGQNGVFTNIFKIQSSIYGFWGIVAGSVLYSFPVAFLMIYDVLNYEDHQAYEAADVLGISRLKQFFVITWPYLKKPLVSVTFAVFTLVVTDYGVPLMIGGKYTTLPVMMYQEVIGLLDFNKGAVIGLFLLVPAVIAFILDTLLKENGTNDFLVKQIIPEKNKLRDVLVYGLCIFFVILISLPLIAFLLMTFMTKYPVDTSFTFDNILKTFYMDGGRYLLNSLTIAISVAVMGVVIAYIVAYITARTRKSMSSRGLHLLATASLAIPGIVLGLSYVQLYKESFLYGTIFLLVIVNIVHFFSSPYLMAYNSLEKININLEDVGKTLGVNRLYLLKDVIVPQTFPTLLEMFSCFFVNSMITISAVSFLSTLNNMPLSLMITQFEAQMLLECSAFVSLLLLTCNLMMKGTVFLIKKHIKRQEGV